MKVLLVDDHTLIRSAIARLLTALGHDVVDVGTARAAEKEFATTVFDVLMVDFHLGDGDGLELARNIEPRRSHPLSIIFASGNIEGLRRAAGIQAPNHYFLEKPFSAASLERVLAAISSC